MERTGDPLRVSPVRSPLTLATEMKYKSQAIEISGNDANMVARKPSDDKVDAAVTGVIVSILAFPLLLGAIALGLWMLFVAATEGAPAIIVAMGIGFVLMGYGLYRLFAVSLMAFVSVRWAIRKNPDGQWHLKKYVASIRVFNKVCGAWSLRCLPSYSRGDWGHFFVLECERGRVRFSPPAVFTDSKNEARRLAEQDARSIRACFGVECELDKWE